MARRPITNSQTTSDRIVSLLHAFAGGLTGWRGVGLAGMLSVVQSVFLVITFVDFRGEGPSWRAPASMTHVPSVAIPLVSAALGLALAGTLLWKRGEDRPSISAAFVATLLPLPFMAERTLVFGNVAVNPLSYHLSQAVVIVTPWLALAAFMGLTRSLVGWTPAVHRARWNDLTPLYRHRAFPLAFSAVGAVTSMMVAAIWTLGSRVIFSPFAFVLMFLSLGLPLALARVFWQEVREFRASYQSLDQEAQGPLRWLLLGSLGAVWFVFLAFELVLVGGAAQLVVYALWGAKAYETAGTVGGAIAPYLGPVVQAAPIAVLAGLFLSVDRGAVGPGLTLDRATATGLVTAAFVFIFAGLENVLAAAVEAWLPLPGFVGTLLAGGASALLVLPIRSRVERRPKGQDP